MRVQKKNIQTNFNPLNAELNPICHLLALLGAHHILHVSRITVKFHVPNFCAAYFPGSELTLACVRLLSAAIRNESSPGGGDVMYVQGSP
jgi:hypothetical protein